MDFDKTEIRVGPRTAVERIRRFWNRVLRKS
jgi:hypothetical protein